MDNTLADLARPLLKYRPQLFFEEVEVGQEIPAANRGPYTVMTMAMFAAVSGDFYPSHYDNGWAVKNSHHEAAIAHGLQVSCYLSQLVTDWIFPDGMLRKFSSENRNPTFDGDLLTFKGKVVRKYVQGNEGLLDCEIWGEKASGTKVATGSATVTLPSRG